MINIKQYLNSEFCLDCKGCCRFEDEIWLPHLLKADEKILGFSCVKARKGAQSTLVCRFLDKADHKCKVYEKRPFECVLYPFLLINNNDSLDLVVHLGCPYILNTVNSKQFAQYADYLVKKLLEPDILKLFKQEFDKFHCYPDIELYVIKEGLLSNP